VLDVDLVPTDRNLIRLQEDGAPGRVSAARDPHRTPLEERVAAGTALLLRCHDKRAHRFDFSIRTESAARLSSGWQTHALNTSQCETFPPSVFLPWEIAATTVVQVTARDASGLVVCPATTRTLRIYEFPGARSPVCPDAQVLLNQRQEAEGGGAVTNATAAAPPQHANTWREQEPVGEESTDTRHVMRSLELNKHLLHGRDDAQDFLAQMVAAGILAPTCAVSPEGAIVC